MLLEAAGPDPNEGAVLEPDLQHPIIVDVGRLRAVARDTEPHAAPGAHDAAQQAFGERAALEFDVVDHNMIREDRA